MARTIPVFYAFGPRLNVIEDPCFNSFGFTTGVVSVSLQLVLTVGNILWVTLENHQDE